MVAAVEMEAAFCPAPLEIRGNSAM